MTLKYTLLRGMGTALDTVMKVMVNLSLSMQVEAEDHLAEAMSCLDSNKKKLSQAESSLDFMRPWFYSNLVLCNLDLIQPALHPTLTLKPTSDPIPETNPSLTLNYDTNAPQLEQAEHRLQRIEEDPPSPLHDEGKGHLMLTPTGALTVHPNPNRNLTLTLTLNSDQRWVMVGVRVRAMVRAWGMP